MEVAVAGTAQPSVDDVKAALSQAGWPSEICTGSVFYTGPDGTFFKLQNCPCPDPASTDLVAQVTALGITF
jgi:hypothetical protein